MTEDKSTTIAVKHRNHYCSIVHHSFVVVLFSIEFSLKFEIGWMRVFQRRGKLKTISEELT